MTAWREGQTARALVVTQSARAIKAAQAYQGCVDACLRHSEALSTLALCDDEIVARAAALSTHVIVGRA
jgi:hypothetical protein